jgi:hypothetical protein
MVAGGVGMIDANRIFKPGEICRESGVYEVFHDPEHSKEHEVTCVSGEKFPLCSYCDNPRFVLVHAAHQIGKHKFFELNYGGKLGGAISKLVS